ncbi:AAA family ATPase [Lacisediminihabitans profunda]|uniref:AAA family ATPase n=2 Tax=Lacisediminihabitans profunda TaxID=2594790 RepID=A0A5C8UWR8_9MICO|nr:AAA family ATPase [Lacisediminihabitans profunda]
MPRPSPAPWLMAPARKSDEPVRDEPPSTLRPARVSFLTELDVEPPAVDGWRGLVARATGLQVPPTESELEHRRRVQAVSRHWSGPRGIAVVNGKGGVGKTVTNAMLAAVFARNGGSGVLAWDNNDTRGTLGWRTEKSDHDATVHDLLPETERLLLPDARVSDLAPFVHHQTSDKYDVLRSNPELLATGQRITQADFDALQVVVTKYYRMVFFDSGNDESAPRWLRMIDHTDQLVVATTALGEAAESGALLLEALQDRDEHSARLAENAVVVVLQSERNGGMAAAQRIAEGFATIARAVVTIPFDRALHGGALRFDSLNRATQDAWLAAGAAVADGL